MAKKARGEPGQRKKGSRNMVRQEKQEECQEQIHYLFFLLTHEFAFSSGFCSPPLLFLVRFSFWPQPFFVLFLPSLHLFPSSPSSLPSSLSFVWVSSFLFPPFFLFLLCFFLLYLSSFPLLFSARSRQLTIHLLLFSLAVSGLTSLSLFASFFARPFWSPDCFYWAETDSRSFLLAGRD